MEYDTKNKEYRIIFASRHVVQTLLQSVDLSTANISSTQEGKEV